MDTDGIDNDNIAGIYMSSSEDVVIENSIVHDNFDRLAEDTGGQRNGNSTNIVVFRGANVRIQNNEIYNTPATSADMHGGCIKYKHETSDAAGTFEVLDNVLRDCWAHSVGTGSPNTTISGNLIVDSSPIWIRDFGGPTTLQNIEVSYNTFLRSEGMAITPDATRPPPLDNVRFTNNVVIDEREIYNTDESMLRIGSYSSDEQHDIAAAPGTLMFESNCYFNPSMPAVFNFFGANGGTRGEKGDLHNFAEWQALGYDLNSFEGDPNLDANNSAQATQCSDSGYDRWSQ